MSSQHDDFPEVAPGHDLPEAYHQSHPEPVWSPQPSIAPTYVSQPQSAYPPSAYGQNGQYTDVVKPGSAAGPGTGVPVGGVMSHDASYQAPGSADPEKTHPPAAAAATVCGISLVLLLSIVIAILSAAVIGLAAGTGVAASNYNDAKSQVRQLKASLSAAQAKATPTSSSSSSSGTSTPTDWNSITNGCSDNPGDVNGTRYTSQCKCLFVSGKIQHTVILILLSFRQCQLYHVLRQGYPQPLAGVLCFRQHLPRLHGCLRRMEQLQHDKRKMRGRLLHSRMECLGHCAARTRSWRLLPQAFSVIHPQPDGSQHWRWRGSHWSARLNIKKLRERNLKKVLCGSVETMGACFEEGGEFCF